MSTLRTKLDGPQVLQNSHDEATQAIRTTKIGSFAEGSDYIGVTYPSGTTEVYTYKTGGSGGTTVLTITVVYTDSTKASISSVTKS